MTKRDVTNKYFPQLIMIMENPIPVLKYIEPWSGDLAMKDVFNNIPDSKIPTIWNMIKTSKFRESPKPILDAFQKELKEATN